MSQVYELGTSQYYPQESKRATFARKHTLDLLTFVSGIFQSSEGLQRLTGHEVEIQVSLNSWNRLITGIYSTEHPGFEVI